MRLQLFSLVGLLLMVQPYFSQVTYAKPEEFKELKKRPLVVQTLEVKQVVIDRFKKKKAKAKKPAAAKKYGDMITEYRNFVESYNTNIKTAVEKYWKLNTEVIYKTVEEVDKLRKSKSSKYTVLWYSESKVQSDGRGSTFRPLQSLPTINYSRIEKGLIKVDYSIFMPYLNKEEDVTSLADFMLTLKLMQNHISSIESTGKKKYIFKNYAKEEAKNNCKDLAKKDLIITEKDVHKKATFSQISSAYKNGKMIKYTNEAVIKAIENEDDVIIGITIPWMIAQGSSSAISAIGITTSRILYLKSFINVKTGKLYTCFGTVTGEFNDPYYRVKEFTKYGKCK